MSVSAEYDSDLARLDFADGDLELMYEDNHKGRHWWHGVEAFFRVVAQPTPGSEHIEFRRLTDDGVDMLDQPDKPYSGEYVWAHKLGFMADVLFSRGVLFVDDDKWTQYAEAAPLPATMNRIADELFVPLGAHGLKLSLMEGDGDDNKFTPTAIVHALAEGLLPVSATARYFLHDMSSHALGMLAMDAKTMKALQNICQVMVEHETDDAFEAEKLNEVIANFLDYFTFEKNFRKEEIAGSRPELIAGFFTHPDVLESPLSKKLLNAAREAGFNITRGGYVTHDSFVEKYHSELRNLFTAHATR